MEKINFYTQSSLNQTPELRMVIDVSGNVGIGESNPTKSLEVVGDISFNGNLYQNGALFTGGSTIDETTDVSLNNLKVHGDLSANDVSFNVIDTASINVTGDYQQNGANINTIYATIASPTLTGTPAAPTASSGTNTTQLATTAFVSTAVSNLVNGAPGALDTLSELASALDNSGNFATNVTNTLGSLQTQIDAKEATLTFNAPSSNNTNPSTSAQIKTALDAKQDTLTAGTNITITGTTISASGGGGGLTDLSATSISDLSDVSFNSTTTTDGATLLWDTTEQLWKPSNVTNTIGVNMVTTYFSTYQTVTLPTALPGYHVSELDLIIKPTYTDSIIEIKFNIYGDFDENACFRIKRNNDFVVPTTDKSTNALVTGIYDNDETTTPITHHVRWYDTPNTTDSITYKLYINRAHSSSITAYINGTGGNSSDWQEQGISTSTVIEHPKPKTLVPATSVTKQGQVLETLAGVCDGRTVVVESGSYTLGDSKLTSAQGGDNTLGSQVLNETWQTVRGSEISYLPPSGTKQVIFKFHVAIKWNDPTFITLLKLSIDSTDNVFFKCIRHDGYAETENTFVFVIDVGSQNSISNGQFLTWNTSKTLKLQARNQASSNNSILFQTDIDSNAAAGGGEFIYPTLEIQAIGESSGQAVTLTTNSVNDLSDISFNTASTTDGQALVWNSTDGVWEAGAVASSGGGGLTDLSASSISDLSDVSFNSLSTSQGSGLIWNNADKLWEPGPLTASITNTSTTTTNTTGWNQQSTSGTVPATSAYSDIVVYNDSGTDYLIFSTGWTGSQSNKTYRYNISTSTWGELSTTNNVPVRYGPTAGIYNNNYYVFGGRSSSDLNDTWKLNLTTNAWSQLSTTGTSPVARRYPNSGVYNGKLIIFGGYGSTAYNDVWELNLSTLAWTRLHDGTGTAPPARYIHSVNITGDNLYTFGGINSGTTYNDTWKFNLTNNTWSQLSTTGTTPSSRRSSDSIIYNNNLYIFGGVNSSAYLNDVWELNLSTLAWKELHDGTGTAPAARVEFKVVLYNAKLYLFGGNDASILLSDTWEFTLPQYSTTYNPVEINKLSTKYALSIGPNYDTASLDNSGSLIVEGNVGIGISDPSGYKLEVAGDISFNGNLYQNGALFTGGSTIDETTDVSLNNLDIHGKLDISGYLQSTDSAVSTPYTSLNVTNSLFISITTALSRGNTTGITMNTLVYDNDTWIAYVHNSNYTKMIRIKAIYQNNTVYIGITESKFFSGSQTSDYIKTNWGSATTAVIYPTNSNGYGANVVISIFGAQQTAIDLNDVSTIQNTPNSSWDVFTNITSSQIYTENNSVDFTADVHIETFTYGTSNQSSDDRIKHNEEPITNALSILAKITPKHYFKTGSTLYDASHNFALNDQNHPLSESGSPLLFKKDYTIETGIIAQEIQSIPELKFAVQNTTPLGVDYNSIHCTHIAATKELHQLVQSQQTIIEEQQQEIEHLKLVNQDINVQLNTAISELQTIKHYLGI